MAGTQELEHKPQEYHHEPFVRSHVSMGSAGALDQDGWNPSPLVICKFVKDVDKRWRYIRPASVATTRISEGLYTSRVRREREERRERGGR